MDNVKNGLYNAIVIIATFFGGIMGATAGLLFAPQADKKTRELIRVYYDMASGKGRA